MTVTRETKMIVGRVICLNCHKVYGETNATYVPSLNGYVCHPCKKEICIGDSIVKHPNVIKELYEPSV